MSESHPSPSIPEELFKPICLRIGYIIVAWAAIEQNLDCLISAVFHRAQDGPAARKLPFGFKNRAEYLRKAFCSVQALQSLSSEGIFLLDGLWEVAPVRDSIVHGTLHDFDRETGQIIFLCRQLPAPRKKLIAEKHTLSLDDLDRFVTLSLLLRRRSGELCERFVEVFAL